MKMKTGVFRNPLFFAKNPKRDTLILDYPMGEVSHLKFHTTKEFALSSQIHPRALTLTLILTVNPNVHRIELLSAFWFPGPILRVLHMYRGT